MFRSTVCALFLLTLAATAAHSADAPGGRAPRSAADLEARFNQYDTNHDGKLTLNEYVSGNTQNGGNNTAAKRAERFKAMDTDKDGLLTLDEYQAGRAAMGRNGQRKSGNAQT